MDKEELSQCVGRLEGKLDGVIARLDKYNGSVAGLFKDVEALKMARAEQNGAIKMIGLLAGFVSGIASAIITAITIKFLKL